MTKIAVGLFDNFEHARMAVEELVQAGFNRENISLIANSSTGEVRQYISDEEKGEEIGEGALGGAGIGAVVGGLGGLLVGLGALAIPGIGPVLAAGPLITALAGAGIGAAAGGLLGALAKAGIPSDEAELYAEGVRRGGTLVTVNAADDMADRAVDILNHHNPVDVEKRSEEWRQGNWTGFDESAAPYTAEQIDTERSRYRMDMDVDVNQEGKTVLPVIEEELRVGKREVETGGVRIHTRTEEEPVEEEVHLREERVQVERRPVDRPVSAGDIDAFQEGTIEVTGRAEQAVVDKQARVVEEVEISKDVEEHTETIRDSVRRTDVDVEEVGAGATRMAMGDIDDYDDFFQQHYNTTYGTTTYTYDQYRPYYQYGWQLGADERFRNRRWDEIEMDARSDWERSNPGSLWDDFKDAVREGWQRATGQR
jgi:uncharacterized protein (TIGR02271 family)